MYEAIIFDFDGTIIDTEIHLFNTLNKNIENYKNPPISLDEYKASIGSVSKELDEKIFNALGSEIALKEMFEYDGPVVADFRIIQKEKVYPMIAPGKGIQEMIGVTKWNVL